MGVAVITLQTPLFRTAVHATNVDRQCMFNNVGRQVMFNIHLGLADLVAGSPSDFVVIASKIASDPARLFAAAKERRGGREREGGRERGREGGTQAGRARAS
jgi:hypothetical protein